jgi:hypothetical protein
MFKLKNYPGKSMCLSQTILPCLGLNSLLKWKKKGGFAQFAAVPFVSIAGIV